jgi:poly-gamma-glutamate capsule biosynthesis protein CapA/YwtB (metallophosphatase superfamily)
MRTLLACLALIVSACAFGAGTSTESATTTTHGEPTRGPTATLLFVGDVMVGRRVLPVLERDGPGVFEGVRFVVSSADLAVANLESPLTGRPHISSNPNALEAPSAAAGLLAGAGFDLMTLANNHSGDAGPAGLVDTIDALAEVGVREVGAGDDLAEAGKAVQVDVGGVSIAFLAFDVTHLGLEAGRDDPGVFSYSPVPAHRLVEEVSSTSDLVVVSLHGGVEYLSEVDPILEGVSADLIGWGADVVWGHGSHVGQPVSLIEARHGRPAIVATSLGNFLFDQQRRSTQTGLILETLVSRDGVEAYRIGKAFHGDLRVAFMGWELPSASAVLLDGEWWSLVRDPATSSKQHVSVPGFPLGDVSDAGIGDVTGDGRSDLVVSYRHPFRDNEVNTLYQGRDFTDEEGRSAHLGVFDPVTLQPTWAAGTLLRPVAHVAVCDSSLALAFDSLDDPEIVAAGAWTWWDFGFATAPDLPGVGSPSCVDVDGDGLTDPVISR